jgi:hypothetical protein
VGVSEKQNFEKLRKCGQNAACAASEDAAAEIAKGGTNGQPHERSLFRAQSLVKLFSEQAIRLVSDTV